MAVRWRRPWTSAGPARADRLRLWIGGLCAAGLVVFLLWPTNVPPIDIDLSRYAGFSMLRGVDAAGNAFPSMHVATAIFTMLRLQDVWRRIGAPALIRIANLTWCSAIVLSTLFIKQHVVLDVISGALLGAAFAAASLCAPRLAALFAASRR